MPTAAVILAGGSGSRVGAVRDGAAVNKVYLPLGGLHVISWSVNAFARARNVARLVLVTRPADAELARKIMSSEVGPAVEIIEGGPSRHDSEYAALRHLRAAIERGEIDLVAVHDGARPMVSDALVAAVLDAAKTHGGCIPGMALDDLVPARFGPARVGPARMGPAQRPEVESGRRISAAVRVQTPQAFHAGSLLDSYWRAAEQSFTGTDTASCVQEFSSMPIRCVPGEHSNIKITFASDVALAELLLANRVGQIVQPQEDDVSRFAH